MLRAGCSTMKAALEKQDEGPTASATATAPTTAEVTSLIEDAYIVMASACGSAPPGWDDHPIPGNTQAPVLVGKAAKCAKGIMEVFNEVRS